MRSLERMNIRTYVRTYSHTYVRDRPYIPSTTLLCEGINKDAKAMTKSLSLWQGHKKFAIVNHLIYCRKLEVIKHPFSLANIWFNFAGKFALGAK